MCIPGCLEQVRHEISRRQMLKSTAAVAGAALGLQSTATAIGSAPRKTSRRGFRGFERVVDLTHPHSDKFPHYRGGGTVAERKVMSSTEGGEQWNVYQWLLDEHAGTHIDAPFHRNADGVTVDQIPAEDLVLPLAVIDIRIKASANDDAQLTLEDLVAWEGRYGKLPAGCCVAMNSGWDKHVWTDQFINFDEDGVRHFPGFHVDAAHYLLEECDVKALAVDTASLDHGPTEEYPVHVAWLGANRWGLENVASLAKVPAWGATIVAGAPRIVGATGGHTRTLALV
jgi:kynurenine formamidase